MDANTKDVLLALIALISVIVTPLITMWVAAKQRKKIDIIDGKVGVVETKLDESHKQMNGNFTKVLDTTASLANALAEANKKLTENGGGDVPKRE